MKKITYAFGAILVGLMPVAAAVPASAASPKSHCWLDLSSSTTRCFGSFAESVAAVSGGRVRLAAGATSLSEAQRAEIAAVTATSSTASDVRATGAVVAPRATAAFVLGTWFENAGYGGSSFMATGTTDCDTSPDVDYSMASMPPGWNDRISSFRSYGQCAAKLWENTFSGASYGFVANSSYVGDTMNDRASSVQWN